LFPDIVRTGLLRNKAEIHDAGATQRKAASGGKTTGSRYEFGGQSRNRTKDTRIFNPLLYQLS
jgi:hypothetical protein